jgi:hypothetical protein
MPVLGTLASSVQKITGSFESIATATGTGSSGVITFSSIPSTYKFLQIRMNLLMNGDHIDLTFNGDTGSNYTEHYLGGDGGTVYAGVAAGNPSTRIYLNGAFKAPSLTHPYVGILDIHDYASTTRNKTIRYFGGINTNQSSGEIILNSGSYMSTSAITSITMTNPSVNFSTNTKISLYGIKGA